MPEFVRTTKHGKGRASHAHIAYLRDDGTGYTSENNGHSHNLFYRTPQPMVDDMGMPMVDALSGEPMLTATEEGWVVDEAGGHVHDLAGAVFAAEKKEKKKDEEIVAEVKDLFRFAVNYESDARRDALESEEMHDGKQWRDSHKRELESADRAAHTLNMLEAGINLLSGYQRQNRSDIRFFPVENGDGRVADILTEVVKNICEQNDFQYAETNVFEDMAIVGRGHFNVYVDYEKNLEGDIVIEHFGWKDTYLGPHEYADGRDCEYGFKAKWYSLAKLKQLWPDKADDFSTAYEMFKLPQEEPTEHTTYQSNQYEESEQRLATLYLAEPEFVNLAKKQFRLLECERRVYRRVPILVHDYDDFYFNATDWAAGDINAVKAMPGFTVLYQKVSDLRRTKIAGSVLLEDETFEEEDFAVITAYAKKRGNKWWGKIHPAKDAQKELNKRHSQLTDIMNKSANYGHYYDADTFPGERQKSEFKRKASSPGFVIEVTDTAKPPKQTEGVKVPAEIIAAEEGAFARLNQILHIQPDLMGNPPNDASGLAIIERKKQGLIGNEFLFDNLNLAKKLLGKRLVKLIQKVYTPERMVRIIENRMQRAPVQIGGQEMMLPGQDMPGMMPQQGQPQQQGRFNREEYLQVLETADLTKFDVVVGESAHSPTTMMANFALLAEMSQRMPIPPEALIEIAPMPDEQKRKILGMLAAAQQAQAQQQQQESQTEIQKTMIAAQSRQQQGPPAPPMG